MSVNDALGQHNLKYWAQQLLAQLAAGATPDDPLFAATALGLQNAVNHLDQVAANLPDLTLIREQCEDGLTVDVEHQCPATFALACIINEVVPEHDRELVDPAVYEAETALEQDAPAMLDSDDDPVDLLAAIVHEYEQTCDGEVDANGNWITAASIPVDLMERAKACVAEFQEPKVLS